MLLALAIAPGLAICFYIFFHDMYDREPGINLIMSFVWGMICIIPAFLIEMVTQQNGIQSPATIVLNAFLLVGLVEEGSKFLVLRYYSFTRKSFDEPLDGIVYSVMVSMGFATIENIGYVIFTHSHNGIYVGLVRMFSSVPAHASFGVIMGYFTGLAKFNFQSRNKLLFKGLMLAAVAHAIYDSFLFLTQNNYMKEHVAELFLFGGAMVSLYVCIYLSRRLIRLHRNKSRQLFSDIPELSIQMAGKNDIELIHSLAMQVWPLTYRDILSSSQINYMLQLIYSRSSLEKQMDEGQQFVLVYNAGHPIGFASFGPLNEQTYKLHKIYILPKQQKRGTGKYVIAQVIRAVKEKGATTLRLNVNRNNQALGFYEKLGFSVMSSEDIDIGHGYFMNDYIMEKNLEEIP